MGRRPDRFATRFDADVADPLASMANLVDVMLVFACGLIAALAMGRFVIADSPASGTPVREGRELPELPSSQSGRSGQGGMQSVGRVYRDAKSGRLILVDEGEEASPATSP